MPRVRRDWVFTLGFAALALALALWQMPGTASSDTKIDLHVDPSRFLSDVASVWTPTSGLGEVQSAQYGGYLWPMAPFFAVLHGAGLSSWLVQRLWLALVLSLAAWGMLRLLDQMIGRPRGIFHLVATTFWVVNPYTTVFTARTTITLLGYAALPWLLLCVQQGLRSVRGWRAWWWPAAFALIFTSTGGGVNAAVVFYMAIGPVLLMLYEPAVGHVRWRAAGAFFARTVLLSVLASLWWLSALLVHVQYGIDFLQYTEQPHTIWSTNAITESLRLMGYWTSYLGAGYPRSAFPYFSDGGTLLYNVAEVGASLLLPALAILGFLRARRHRYGPFFVLMVVAGVIVMSAGFPDGTPLRGTMTWIYQHVFVSRFLRTVNKAAPLTALGLACLLGALAQGGWALIRSTALPRRGRRLLLVGAPVGLAALIVLAALPLFGGRALDRQITWKSIPQAWRAAGAALDRSLASNSRAIVLPGQIFDFYRWGGTVDPILPRLTTRPVAVRYETPYSDLHADDLLLTVDNLVQQDRLLPGQLRPLLSLVGAGSVISATDDDIRRSGAVDPAVATLALSGQGLGAPRAFGSLRSVPPLPGDLDPVRRLPQVRSYAVPVGRGIVHLDHGPPVIVDGSAAGVADLAATGQFPARSPIFYAGDLGAGGIRRAAAGGAQIVISDSNRRQFFLPQFTQQDVGPVLPRNEAVGTDEANIDPFAGAGGGADGQTVSILGGVSYLRAPHEYGLYSFPEQAPFAAFDGDPRTTWVPFGEPPAGRWLQVGFLRRRAVPYIDVLPLGGTHDPVRALAVDGRTVPVRPGWNRVRVGGRARSSLRIQIAAVGGPSSHRGPGGISELRIPGIRVTQVLRPPVIAGHALANQDLRHVPITFLFSRVTGDDPFRRDRYVDTPGEGSLADRQDAEAVIRRVVFAPARRAYRLQGWVQPAPGGSDAVLDRLAGLRGGATFESSARFHDRAVYRASSAFDGTPGTAWVGLWIPGAAPRPWIGWSTTRPLTVRRLRLIASGLPVRRPTVVSLNWPGGGSSPIAVGPGGQVELPSPVRARAFRLTVLATARPAGVSSAMRGVGIGSVIVPGLATAHVPRTGILRSRCGDVQVEVSGRTVPLRVAGTVAALDAGTPLQASACGSATMPAGIQQVSVRPGPLAVDLLSMRSAAPDPLATVALGSGAVTDPGRIGRYSVRGVRVSLARPAWLVLGESFDSGWRASCDGRSLGVPRVIDGYANGWWAPAGCRAVGFEFSPQQGVNRSYVISGLVCLVLVLLLLFTRPRRRPAGPPAPEPAHARPSRLGPLPWRRAAALAIALAVPLGFIFAARAGAVIAVAMTLLFRRGLDDRRLTLAAAWIVGVAVPVAYVISQPENKGGYNFDYGVELIYAHWIGVGAVILFGLAGWLSARSIRRRATAAG